MTRPGVVPPSEFREAIETARSGRHAQAQERVERALQHGPLPTPRKVAAAEALVQIAKLAESAGEPARAADALEAALRLRPDYPDLRYRRGRLLIGLQRRAEARRELDRALALKPDYAAARLERALLDAADGFIGDALASLRALARESTLEQPALFQEGIERLEQADWDAAGALLSRALAPGPGGDPGPLDRAGALLDEGEVSRAAEALEEALPGREDWADLHFLLGMAELQRGHADDALASLARALEINPDYHAARVQFACALEAVGARAQALEQVALVLQVEPDHALALELHERWTARGRPAARVAHSTGHD
jgi:tetratricopeptide (TPR) repeat protein